MHPSPPPVDTHNGSSPHVTVQQLRKVYQVPVRQAGAMYMKLAAGGAPKEGLTVETDLVSGRVAVTGSKPGHYFLDYSAAFGSSAVAQGALRVDIDPAQEDNRSPVAVPASTCSPISSRW